MLSLLKRQKYKWSIYDLSVIFNNKLFLCFFIFIFCWRMIVDYSFGQKCAWMKKRVLFSVLIWWVFKTRAFHYIAKISTSFWTKTPIFLSWKLHFEKHKIEPLLLFHLSNSYYICSFVAHNHVFDVLLGEPSKSSKQGTLSMIADFFVMDFFHYMFFY